MRDAVDIYTPMCIDENGILYEEIYDSSNGEAKFIGWDRNQPIIKDFIDKGKSRYHPIVSEAVTKKVVLLPTYPVNYGDITVLVDEIYNHIYKYLDISDKYKRIASWYIVSTWLIDKIGTTSYLRGLGDYGTGKSRFKRVIGGLCYKPLFISGAVTPAPIYRMIEKFEGTLVFDELDLNFSDETNFVIKILNCGSERQNPIMRCKTDNPDNVQFFETFSPKVFCTRKRFKDQALETRCLTEILKETNRTDIPAILTDFHSFYQEEMELRNKLLMFRLQNWKNIKITEPENIDLGNLEPRLKQDIIPMAMLFWHIPGMKKAIMDFIKNYSRQMIQDRASSDEGMIVNAIYDLIDGEKNGLTNITSSTIGAKVKEKFESGGHLKPATIGKYLRILGLETRPVKIDGKTKRILVFDKSIMENLKRKYVSEVTEDTEVTDNRGG